MFSIADNFDSKLSIHKYQKPDSDEAHRLVLQTGLDFC